MHPQDPPRLRSASQSRDPARRLERQLPCIDNKPPSESLTHGSPRVANPRAPSFVHDVAYLLMPPGSLRVLGRNLDGLGRFGGKRFLALDNVCEVVFIITSIVNKSFCILHP